MEPGCIAGCQDEAGQVVVDFVDRVHGTGFPEIRPWRPRLAIPVEIVEVVRGTDSYG